MSEDSIAFLVSQVSEFSRLRDWEKFHSPKNLAMAISGEAGELVAEFQWLKEEESEGNRLSDEKLEAIRFEMADIQIYLLRLADRLEVDLGKAVLKKLEINENRFKI
jgi:NTP pyrophosphatase (non-canonical NTP hydrolase)